MAISHSETNNTELFKPKWLVPYPFFKLKNKPLGANLLDKYELLLYNPNKCTDIVISLVTFGNRNIFIKV